MNDPPPRPRRTYTPVQKDFLNFLLLGQLMVTTTWAISPLSLWEFFIWSCAVHGAIFSFFIQERLKATRYRQKKPWFKYFVFFLVVSWWMGLSGLLHLTLPVQDAPYGQTFLKYTVVVGLIFATRRITRTHPTSNHSLSTFPAPSFPLGDRFIQEALRHIQKITVSGNNQEIAKKTTSLIELTSPKTFHSLQEECQIIDGFLSFLPDPTFSVIWRVGHGVDMKSVVPKRSMQYLLRQLLKINQKDPHPIIGSIETSSGSTIELGYMLKTSFPEASSALNSIHAMLDKIQHAFGVYYKDVRTWCSFTSEGLSVGVCFSTPVDHTS